MVEFYTEVRKGVGKTQVEGTSFNGVCDFCLTKGKVYKLRSSYRKYRYLNVCKKCIDRLRKRYRNPKKK
jgi:hypothetical protein